MRMEFGGSYSVNKSLAILKTLLQQGPPSFSFLVKGSTHVLHKLATADTRKDSVEEMNKVAAQGILTSIGQPVSEAQLAMGSGMRTTAFATDDAPRGDNKTLTSGKTPWQEMQEQQLRDARRKDKEMKHLKEQAIAERAAEMRKSAVTFDIEGAGGERIIDKLMGTRKRVPASELKAFSDALSDSYASQETLIALGKRLQEDSIVTRMKVLEAIVQVLKDAKPYGTATFVKSQKRLTRIKDARSETGLEKKTEHCAALAAEALQLLENPPVAPLAQAEASLMESSGFSFASGATMAAAPTTPATPATPAAATDVQQQLLALQMQQQQLAALQQQPAAVDPQQQQLLLLQQQQQQLQQLQQLQQHQQQQQAEEARQAEVCTTLIFYIYDCACATTLPCRPSRQRNKRQLSKQHNRLQHNKQLRNRQQPSKQLNNNRQHNKQHNKQLPSRQPRTRPSN